MCKQAAAQPIYCQGIFLICDLQTCQGTEVKVMRSGGGLGALVRTRECCLRWSVQPFLPYPCDAIAFLPMGSWGSGI